MVLPQEKDAFKALVGKEGTTMSDFLRLVVVERISKGVDR